MHVECEIYEEFGVPTVVNAAGTKTRISGSVMRSEAADAMREAANAHVRISDLQAAASERISEATGADAGYVTSGAAGGLTLAAAACIAGDDLGAMYRLPETGDRADEIVLPRAQNTEYSRALRVAGASLVDIGTNDKALGSGSVSVEPWEYADAISEDTAAVAYIATPATETPIEDVVEVAHDNDVPVIVDAAAELPPQSNLERFVEAGADLVAFSGGKAIRGPQTTGILAGREALIRSAALQHLDMDAVEPVWDPPASLVDTDALPGVPRHGIGRPMKVGKEEIAGLLRALELFIAEDEAERQCRWHERAAAMADGLTDSDAYDPTILHGDDDAVASTVSVRVRGDRDAADIVRSLRRENPRVFVGAAGVPDGEFSLNPMCLTDEEAEYAVERLLATA